MTEFDSHPNLDCEVFPDDLRAIATVYDRLAKYARVKADAMSARQAGRIVFALRAEQQCDEIYSALPAWARW